MTCLIMIGVAVSAVLAAAIVMIIMVAEAQYHRGVKHGKKLAKEGEKK